MAELKRYPLIETDYEYWHVTWNQAIACLFVSLKVGYETVGLFAEVSPKGAQVSVLVEGSM